MRTFNTITLGCILVGGLGCASTANDLSLSVHPPGTVKLKVGGAAAIEGTPWTLQFDSVVSDSRCPLGVLCIQAGEALLSLELTSPLADGGPRDNPHFGLGSTPATIEGLRFSQVEVTPIRRVDVKIDPRTYVATIMIEAVVP